MVIALVSLPITAWMIRAGSVAGDDPAGTDPIGAPAQAMSPAPGGAIAAAPSATARATAPPPSRADHAWVAAIAARTGIPAWALTAYADAHLATTVVQPGCHLTWNMLAGIGLVESNHGRHGGASLQPDGTTSVPILGPALDGTGGNMAIPVTRQGLRLHGDPRWDHAVGPMQFLPTTWATWGRSADGHVPDPHDIDDAALAAAAYLCAQGRDLATAAGWRAAVAAYNAPDAYATQVTDAANRYAQSNLP